MSAVISEKKRTRRTAAASVCKHVWIDEDVDVELADIDAEDMAEHLRELGYIVVGIPGTEGEGAMLGTFEQRIYEAIALGRQDDVKRLIEEMLYERLGRIVCL